MDASQQAELIMGKVREFKRLRDESESLMPEIAQHSISLRERIEAGETTGDRIRDILLLRSRNIPVNIYLEEEDKRYHLIDALLKGHVGEMALIFFKGDSHIDGDSSLSGRFSPKTYFACTVLTGEELAFPFEHSSQCRLPSSEMVVEKNGGSVTYHDSPLGEDLMLGLPFYPEEMHPPSDLPTATLIVGNGRVEHWLKMNRSEGVFVNCADLLGNKQVPVSRSK